MPPTPVQDDESFDEAERTFDLRRLKQDLEARKLSEITDAPWRYFKGVLCVGDPDEIAKRCYKSPGNVRDSLIANIKPYLLEILQLPEEQRIVWSRVAKWLIDAGYGLTEFSWQRVCRAMWQKQKEDQRIRRRVSEKGFEVNVHVGLGLIQREQQQRRQGYEYDRSHIYDLTDREAIVRRFEHGEFLAEVIEQPPKANKHVAIIGEPGAGKTTLLAAIADRLSHSDALKLPICLSLAGLQKKTLQDYLLQIWLPEAFKLVYADIDLDETHRTTFQNWLRRGEAWLLLDGVDEMGEEYPATALNTIKTQLIDWLGNVRVALTCRSNVWDAQLNNPLSGAFDVYKTQEFKLEQIKDFIQQWFSQSKKPERGQALQQELNEPQRERIRELVRNPLRLSLLCEVFYINPNADLPQTKAGLYEIFVRYFYEWKLEQQPTKQPQREKLNQALGKLAISGLDNEHGLQRFRLPEKAARKVMGNKPFELAEKLGWLNIVDQDVDSPQAVYAFFHPTFQEYFAALAIDDWDYFLPREHNDKPVEGKSYRTFHSEWEESILLWIGRRDILCSLKDEFIKTLVSFRDQCNGFYTYRSHFLAAVFISQFEEYLFGEIIITKIIEYAFGNYLEPIQECGRTTLLKTDYPISSNLAEFVKSHKLSEKQIQAILWSLLGRTNQLKLFTSTLRVYEDIFNPCSRETSEIDSLLNILESTEDLKILEDTIDILGRIGINHRQLIDRLIDILENFKVENFKDSEYDFERVRERAIWCLGKIFNGENGIISSLLNVFQTPMIEFTLSTLLATLVDIGKGNLIIIDSLNQSLNSVKNKMNCFGTALKRDQLNHTKTLSNILRFQGLSIMYFDIAQCLLRVNPGNKKSTGILVDALKSSSEIGCCREVSTVLVETLSESKDFWFLISNLKEFITEDARQNHFERYSGCYEVLWHCAQNMSYPEFYAAWHNPSSVIDSEAIADRPSLNLYN